MKALSLVLFLVPSIALSATTPRRVGRAGVAATAAVLATLAFHPSAHAEDLQVIRQRQGQDTIDLSRFSRTAALAHDGYSFEVVDGAYYHPSDVADASTEYSKVQVTMNPRGRLVIADAIRGLAAGPHTVVAEKLNHTGAVADFKLVGLIDTGLVGEEGYPQLKK